MPPVLIGPLWLDEFRQYARTHHADSFERRARVVVAKGPSAFCGSGLHGG